MLEDDAPSDTLSAEELEARRLRALAEAEEELRRKKAEEDAIAAAAAAAAALRAQKEMVRSAAIGRRAQVTIILSEGATIDYLVEVRASLCLPSV